MATEILLPRMGWQMSEGSIAEWRKRDGDAVTAGEVIGAIEGDKAVEDLEAPASGVLRIPPDSPAPGEKVPIGTIIAYVVQPGALAPFEAAAASPPTRPTASVTTPTPSAPPSSPAIQPPSAPAARLPATPEIPAVVEVPARRRDPAISPRARRIAEEIGVDWASLDGSGRTGRIVERDVRGAAPADRPAAAASPAPTAVSGVRRLIAERMAASARAVAPVTLTTEADATALAQLRVQLKLDLAGASTPVPTYNDLFAKIVAVALGEHPDLNASLTDDGIVRHAAVHVGIAVDGERGLLVPVIRDVQAKSIERIAAESADLIERARTGRIAPDDLRGGTFTITNLGMYEIDAFTPIVNLPEAAILGIGRIVARPVVVDDESERVAVRKMVALSLTFDHRLVDGAPAARFLRRIKHLVEHPMAWVIK